MATNYTGNATPTLNNAPANSWATDAEKRSHVGNTYLVTGSGGTAGNVYAFEKYPSAVVKEVPASGLPAEIVTITNGGENLPMTSAEVSLSPIQDLNGYDSPWPAGGGKNLLKTNDFADYTNNGVTWHRNDDGSVVLNGTATARSYKYLNGGYYLKLEPGTYTASASGLESGGPFGNIAYSTTENGTYAGTFGTLGGTISKRTFTVANTIYLGLLIDVPSGSANSNRLIKIQIEAGSTATEWSPYSNICPISGHTGVELKIGATYPTADNTYSVTFSDQGTVYGGTFDFVTGKLVVEWVNIDSYNGETITEPWLSSMDVYSAGATPTTGAQVVYKLATPLEYTLSPQQIETLLGENNVWSDAGEISKLVYRSNQYVMAYDWFETWAMPKITRNNGNVIVLPYPQEYTPDIYDVDASTTGRNAAGTMIRDRVAVKHKFNYKFPPLSQTDATEILNAVRDSSFTLTTASPETGAKTNYRVYVGDRSLPVYWMPNHNQNSWLYETLTLNLIEM